jgi:hypothetical protein
VHEPTDWNLVPLRRLAHVHRQGPAQRDERLILHALGVARSDRARLMANQVRAGVPQISEFR